MVGFKRVSIGPLGDLDATIRFPVQQVLTLFRYVAAGAGDTSSDQLGTGRGAVRRMGTLHAVNVRQPLTGERIYRDGARLMAGYLAQCLETMDASDPWYDVILGDASRFRALADWHSPERLHGRPARPARRL